MTDSTRNSLWIPNEVWQLIAQQLEIKPTYRLALTCRRFYAVLLDDLYKKALIQDEQEGCPLRTLIDLRIRNSSAGFVSLLRKVDNINNTDVHIGGCRPIELSMNRLKVDGKLHRFLFCDPGRGPALNDPLGLPAAFRRSTLLHVLATIGDDEGIRLLFEERKDVDIGADRGYALLSATARGHKSVVKRLLEAGANPNIHVRFRRNPILLAIEHNRTDLIPLLLEHNADLKLLDGLLHPLTTSIEFSTLQTVKYIYALVRTQDNEDTINECLDNGIYIALRGMKNELIEWILSIRRESASRTFDGKSLLEIVPGYCDYSKSKCSESLIHTILDYAGCEDIRTRGLVQLICHVSSHGYLTALQRIFNAHSDKVRSLVHQSFNGNTALFRAAQNHMEDCVKYLLEKGADIKQPNHKGVSVLDEVVTSHRNAPESLVRLLIDYGVDINCPPKKYKPLPTLHRAILAHQTDTAILLIKAGASLTAKGVVQGSINPSLKCGGHTPLHLAMHFRNRRVIDCLLEYGADAMAVDGAGYTPSDIQPKGRGHWMELVEVLHGPDAPEQGERKYKCIDCEDNSIHVRELPFYRPPKDCKETPEQNNLWKEGL